MYRLVAFDGDDTLWTPASGLNLSDRTPTDATGWPHFTYSLTSLDLPLRVRRDDGAIFILRPEAGEVMAALRARGTLVGIISYNHEGNVRRIVEAFGLDHLIDYVVAEWHTGKDRMLVRMIGMARKDGHDLQPSDTLLVDDDPYGIYKGQCGRLGAGFRCFGRDLTDLKGVLEL